MRIDGGGPFIIMRSLAFLWSCYVLFAFLWWQNTTTTFCDQNYYPLHQPSVGTCEECLSLSNTDWNRTNERERNPISLYILPNFDISRIRYRSVKVVSIHSFCAIKSIKMSVVGEWNYAVYSLREGGAIKRWVISCSMVSILIHLRACERGWE